MNRVINVLAFLLMLLLNGLANGLPLNGYTTGEVSALYPNLFVPAGVTFAVWGLIYLLVLVFVASAWTDRAGAPSSADPALSWPFVVSCIANASWIVAWHSRWLLLSVVIILVLLVSLIVLYRRIARNRGAWYLAVPIGVYLGWVSVAVIANTTALLVYHCAPFDAGVEEALAVSMVVIAVALAAQVLRTAKDAAFALVVAWALLGIWSRTGADTSGTVRSIALAGCVLLAVASIVTAIGSRRRRETQ